MKISSSLVVIWVSLMLSGCETIKSYFPDKEKDYRFTNEIPQLVIPEDIGHSAAPEILQVQEAKPLVESTKPEIPASSTGVLTTPLEQPIIQPQTLTEKPVTPPAESLISEPVVEKSLLKQDFAADVDDSEKPTVTQITALKDADNTAELRVNQNLTRTWRIVGKALTRKAFEITERNTVEHFYLVQFDPDAAPMVDNSLWDDVLFLFGAEKNLEQEYRVVLAEKDHETSIKVYKFAPRVSDDVKKSHEKIPQPCLDEKCAKLFSQLQESLHQSLKE